MTTFFSKPRRSGSLVGELARKGRLMGARPAKAARRSVGQSSMIRLSVPSEGSQAWSRQIMAGAQTLAHWMASRNQRDLQASLFASSEFAPSVLPSA